MTIKTKNSSFIFLMPIIYLMNRHYNIRAISNTPQAITLTIRPFEARGCSLRNLFFSTLSDVGTRFKRCCKKWILYPELTPSAGQLHFHGVVWVKDPIKWMHFVNYYNRMYGYLKLKPIDDLGAWLRYIEKDWFDMQRLLKLQPVMKCFDDRITNESFKKYLPVPKVLKKKHVLDRGVYVPEKPEYEKLLITFPESSGGASES